MRGFVKTPFDALSLAALIKRLQPASPLRSRLPRSHSFSRHMAWILLRDVSFLSSGNGIPQTQQIVRNARLLDASLPTAQGQLLPLSHRERAGVRARPIERFPD